jgi:hypothetical protein
MNEVKGPTTRISTGVSVVQTAQNAGHNKDCQWYGETLFISTKRFVDARQVSSVEVLHRDVVVGGDTPQLVNLNDVGVSQRRTNLRFLNKKSHKFGRAGQVWKDALDHQVALKAFHAKTSGEKNLSHTTLGKPLNQFILPKSRWKLHSIPQHC